MIIRVSTNVYIRLHNGECAVYTADGIPQFVLFPSDKGMSPVTYDRGRRYYRKPPVTDNRQETGIASIDTLDIDDRENAIQFVTRTTTRQMDGAPMEQDWWQEGYMFPALIYNGMAAEIGQNRRHTEFKTDIEE